MLVARRDALEAVAEKRPEVGIELAAHCRRRMVANLVRTSPVLIPIDPNERPALVERFETKVFEKGEKLITEGARRRGLHLVASGEVAVVGHEGGEPFVISTLGVGDVVGEVALVLRRKANADVVAVHPTVTLYLAARRVHRAHSRAPRDLAEPLHSRDRARRRNLVGDERVIGERGRRLRARLNMPHDHASHANGFQPHEARQELRLRIVTGLVCVFFVLELIGAIAARSSVLQADAIHLMMDVFALVTSLVAMRVAVRRPTPRFTFGLRRVEPVVAIFNALLVLGVTVEIVINAIHALKTSARPEAGIMLYVASGALVVNGLSAWFCTT